MSYDDRPEDLKQDARAFAGSEYGKYVKDLLEDTATGHLANADNMECAYPERYLAKHSAITEVLNLLYSPLDDDSPPRG